MFYFYTISGLGLSQETMWVNINFERRDLTSVQKSHPSLEFSGEVFAFNLIKQNVTHFSFIFLTLNFFVPLKNLNLNYYCQVPWVSPYCINGGLSDKGFSSVPPPHRHCLFPSLIFSPTKQPYSKWGKSRMHRYRNAVFTSNFLHFNACMLLELIVISFFLVLKKSMDTPCNVPEKVLLLF